MTVVNYNSDNIHRSESSKDSDSSDNSDTWISNGGLKIRTLLLVVTLKLVSIFEYIGNFLPLLNMTTESQGRLLEYHNILFKTAKRS